MIYNFRIDRSRRGEILRRVKEERKLSQGWGGGSGEKNLRIDGATFVEECKAYHQLATTRVPTNLTWIKEFKDGDLLVVPHLPEDNKVSIHVVDGDFPKCYEYIENDSTCQNHRIRIKESYGLDGNISIDNVDVVAWRGKLPWMRLPVLRISGYERNFKGILDKLKSDPCSRFDQSDLDDYLGNVRKEILGIVRDRLGNISPSNAKISFEKVCEHLLKAEGYTIGRGNHFDGKGGDIDLTCTRLRRDFSPFEYGETRLFVQAKKHNGTSDQEAVLQLIKMMEKDQAADGCVMSLANDFTEDARKMAESNGVLLLTGETICRLFLANEFGRESLMD